MPSGSLKRRIENGTTTTRDSRLLQYIFAAFLVGGILFGLMIGGLLF